MKPSPAVFLEFNFFILMALPPVDQADEKLMLGVILLCGERIFKGKGEVAVQNIKQIGGQGFMIGQVKYLLGTVFKGQNTVVVVGVTQAPGNFSEIPGGRYIKGIRFR